LGRHLTLTEKKWIAAFVLGESSRFTDTGYYDWIIWGLLNKVSWDAWQNKGYSTIYTSWQNEESGVLADFRVTTDEHGTTTAESIKMLNDMIKLYENGETLDEQDWLHKGSGDGLAAEFKQVLWSVDAIENVWFTDGPNSFLDPTHGGVGHVKHGGADDGSDDNGYTSRAMAIHMRDWYYAPYGGPNRPRTNASPIYSFTYIDEKTGITSTRYRFITMNRPDIWWP